MLRMQAASQLTLKDISQRLNKIEIVLKKGICNRTETNDSVIGQFLPLNTIDVIKEFDALLRTTDEAVTQFVIIYIFIILPT